MREAGDDSRKGEAETDQYEQLPEYYHVRIEVKRWRKLECPYDLL